MRRYALMKGATVERVSYAAILARDGRFCHICQQPIADEEELQYDHVIPIGRGGSHTMDNIKPAHGVCNRRKWKHLLEELEEWGLVPTGC